MAVASDSISEMCMDLECTASIVGLISLSTGPTTYKSMDQNANLISDNGFRYNFGNHTDNITKTVFNCLRSVDDKSVFDTCFGHRTH